MSKKIALVTGGTGGIGTEICRKLCAAGHKVISGYLPSDASHLDKWLARMLAEGLDIAIIPGDVSCYESSAKMVADIEQHHGPIDIVVNCAGITRDKTLRKMEPEQWQAVINTNLNSVFNVTRHVVEGMVERGYGRVVNISSVNGQKGQFGQTNYSAAKAGVHGFSMALAQEVAARGVTVNTISPGYVNTQMAAAVPDDIRAQILETIPMGRMAYPEEIANAVNFFCSDAAGYVTGANLPVNGGMYMS